MRMGEMLQVVLLICVLGHVHGNPISRKEANNLSGTNDGLDTLTNSARNLDIYRHPSYLQTRRHIGSQNLLQNGAPPNNIASTYNSILDKVTSLPQSIVSGMITYIQEKLANLENTFNNTFSPTDSVRVRRRALHGNNWPIGFLKAAEKKTQIGFGAFISHGKLMGKVTSLLKVDGLPMVVGNGKPMLAENSGKGNRTDHIPHPGSNSKGNPHPNIHASKASKFHQELKQNHGIDLDKLSVKDLHKLLGYLKTLHIKNNHKSGTFKPKIDEICCPIG